MFKNWSNTLLSLATFIIVAHTIIPHFHDWEGDNDHIVSKKHEQEPKFWKLTEELFNIDVGIEHLEHFQTQDFQQVAIVHDTPISNRKVIATYYLPQVVKVLFIDKTYLQHCTLRGPPIA